MGGIDADYTGHTLLMAPGRWPQSNAGSFVRAFFSCP
jgi:hypothetical protein